MSEQLKSYEIDNQNEKLLDREKYEKMYVSFLDKFDPAKTAWVNPPEIVQEGENIKFMHDSQEISKESYQSIWERKLNGAYSERMANFMNSLGSIIDNDYPVELVQFQKEEGVPFDANGWIVVVVDTMPIFHLSPDDLSMQDVGDFVNIYQDNQDPKVSWKQTNKRGEIVALKMATEKPGLNLVDIAQKYSNI